MRDLPQERKGRVSQAFEGAYRERARSAGEAQELTGYGYTAEKLAAGAALLAEVEALTSKREIDTGESRQATGALNAAWQEADDLYLKALKVARRVRPEPEGAGGAQALRCAQAEHRRLARSDAHVLREPAG